MFFWNILKTLNYNNPHLTVSLLLLMFSKKSILTSVIFGNVFFTLCNLQPFLFVLHDHVTLKVMLTSPNRVSPKEIHPFYSFGNLAFGFIYHLFKFDYKGSFIFKQIFTQNSVICVQSAFWKVWLYIHTDRQTHIFPIL